MKPHLVCQNLSLENLYNNNKSLFNIYDYVDHSLYPTSKDSEHAAYNNAEGLAQEEVLKELCGCLGGYIDLPKDWEHRLTNIFAHSPKVYPGSEPEKVGKLPMVMNL